MPSHLVSGLEDSTSVTLRRGQSYLREGKRKWFLFRKWHHNQSPLPRRHRRPTPPAVPLLARLRPEYPCRRTPAEITKGRPRLLAGANATFCACWPRALPRCSTPPGLSYLVGAFANGTIPRRLRVLFALDSPPARYHGLSRGPSRSGCPATQLRLGHSQTAPAQAAGVTPMAEPVEGRQSLAKCAGPGCACDTDLDAEQATVNPLS
ncbi:hypothetical protein QFZ69_004757 [Arthrobacter sp. V1I7]|nr:hypothetical protein [Arthrobacter sp. V1I7]